MIGIIQDWLFSQLGIYFNLDKLDTNNNFQNGFVFLDIFIRYGLLNSNIAECFATDSDVETHTKNMRLLKPIFDMLSVSFDEDVIFNVAKNSGEIIIKLLYELYIRLENKQQLYFIAQNEFDNILNKHIKCLNEKNIFVSPTKTQTVVTDPDICFKKPLMNNIDLIEWYRNKYKLIEQNVKLRLSKLEKSLHSDKFETIPRTSYQKQYSCPCSCKSDNFNEELVATLPDMDMFNKVDNKNLLNYNQFMALYKAKQQQRSIKQSFEKNIQSELLQQTWDSIMDKQNQIYNTLFSQIMLKQSKYEKQILERLFQTQSQIKVESENKISVSTKIVEEDIRQINCNFELKEEFEELEKTFSDEQARILELHRKLYKQKQDLIKERHYNLCSDVLDSLLDIAVNASEYQSIYGVPVPKALWNSWKQFYYKSQSIHIPFQSVERDISAGEIINYDNIVSFEKESSAVADENDVDEYLYTCGKWFYENICKEFGDINENNLAFIIYRLLSLKYPPPPSPLPPQLPSFRVAAVLLNFHDIDSTEKLKVLLSKPCIHVFDCETAIKRSISKFEEETTVNKDGKTGKIVKEVKSPKVANKRKDGSTTTKNDKTKNKSSKKKKYDPDTDNSKEKNLADDTNDGKLINLINKETQTSIKEDQQIDKGIERSGLGLIGEKVFNTLKEGQKVEDALIVDVIIEYLKTINEFDGWVLLNYPTTIDQALAVELALSGKKLPVEDYTSHIDQFEYQDRKTEVDENAPKRKSKLLMSPNDENNKSSFKTYFTNFIKYKHSSEADESALEKDKNGDHMLQNQENTEPSSSDTIFLDVLEKVYNDQNVYTNFYYESCSIVELKKLARVILKEDGLNNSASIDLFGKETLDKLLSKANKKNKKDSSSGKNKLLEKSKNKKKKKFEKIDPVETENKDLSPENNTLELHKSSLESGKAKNTPKESIQLKLIKPGDEGWHFVSFPLSEEMAIILATMWENLEHCYLQNLEDIFFENRMINLRLVPYSTYVKETVDNVCKKPDSRQELVNLFQNYFMGLDNDLRGLPDVKNHLFCKVLELQQNLWQIIDIKKSEAEAKRQELILENWLLNELCMIINNFLSLVQTELNRSIDTLTIISDYYLNMLGKTLPASNTTHLVNSKVNKVTPDDLMNDNNSEILTNHKDPNKQISSFPENSPEDKINIISQSLINCQESEEVVNFIRSFIPREVAHISQIFQSWTLTYFSQIKTEGDLLFAAEKKLGKQKAITSNQLSKENKKPKDKNNVEKKIDKTQRENSLIKSGSTEQDSELISSQKESLLAEWKFVADSEIDRFKLRMDLISSRAEEDIIEFYCYLESVFCELLSSNLSNYETDINNTNKLCDYLRTTIEEESSLMYPLVLERSNFFLNISQNHTEGFSGIKELFEEPHDCVFSINQLKKLLCVFKIAGPHGVIRKQPFCYILQDLMLFNDTDNQPHLPKAWNLLNEPQLISVLDVMFGLEYAINWRDFLIYNFSIPFPSCDEILFMRNQFMANDPKSMEVITLTEYNNSKLWFEQELPKDPQEGLRYALIKDLLSEMFQVDAQKINYTALLLYLCKDYDPMIGFKKALCLSMGKYVVTSKEELDTILKEEFEIKRSVIGLLDNIINSIVFYKEGTLIYEIFESISTVSVGEVESNYSVSDGTGSRADSLENSEEVIHETGGSQNDSQNQIKCSLESLSSLNSLHLTKTWVSKIPIAAVVSILNASFVHQDKTFSLRNLYLNGLEEESDEDGMIEAHTLVTLDFMHKLFKLTNKFKICIPSEVVKVCLKQQQF